MAVARGLGAAHQRRRHPRRRAVLRLPWRGPLVRGEDFAPRSAFRALFTAETCTLQADGAETLRLPAFALAWADGGAHGIWRVASETPVRAFWIHFGPAT
jgi:hypothetical protein